MNMLQNSYLHFSYQNQLSEGGKSLRKDKLAQKGMSIQISDGKNVIQKNVTPSALREMQKSSKNELRSKNQKNPIDVQKEEVTEELKKQDPAQIQENLNYGVRPEDIDFQQEMSSLQWMNIRSQKNQNKSLQDDIKRTQERDLRIDIAQSKVLVKPDTIRSSLKKQSLEERNREVQAHEMTHAQIASSLQGGMGKSVVRSSKMTYQTDSSGKAYAVGGEVSVDLRPENTTFATKKKADAIMTAALSPDRPSIQDRMVATQALQLKMRARSEEMQKQSQRTNDVFTKVKQDQDGVLSRAMNTVNQTFTPVDTYTSTLKNLGDTTYEAKRNVIRIAKPVAPDGSVQVADAQKEINISPAIGDTQKLPFGGTSFNKSSILSESGQIRQKLNSPVVAIGGTLKTDTKPVIYTSQVESYERIKKIVGEEDRISVRLVDREELENIISQQPDKLSHLEDDEYLASNISSFLATI
jgi:hypothetical protein